MKYNTCQVDISGGFLLHPRIVIWIDLGGGVTVIDLPGTRDSAPATICPDLATESFS